MAFTAGKPFVSNRALWYNGANAGVLPAGAGAFPGRAGHPAEPNSEDPAIVTTVFLIWPLAAGWYGMNFAGMPELRWTYGYPAVIVASAVIVLRTRWILKKKKFW